MAQPRWKRLGFSSQQSFAGKCSAINRKIRKLNPRRFELIHKQAGLDGPPENESSLTEAEEKELESLQKQVGDLVRIIAPLDFSKLEELEKKLTRATEKRRKERKEQETENGIKAIIFLQGTANIEEPEERARTNWLVMSDQEKQTTIETYQMLKAPSDGN